MEMFIVIALIAIAAAAVSIAANWKILVKAGEPGWKCLIPVYGGYVFTKVAWEGWVFWAQIILGVLSYVTKAIPVLSTVLSLIAAVLSIFFFYNLAVRFGKGIGFTIGLIFLCPIFLLILAFGSSQYKIPENYKTLGDIIKQYPKVEKALNWALDHAMIIIIIAMAIYVQIMKPTFFSVPSLVNIVSLTAARLPMALGVAGCIVLAGTDLSGGRVAGMTAFIAAILLQKVGANGKILADIGPQPLLLVLLLVMIVGALVGSVNGFCMGKFKLHPFIVTLATQMITYGVYLTISNSKQVSSLDTSYTTSFVTKPLFKIGPTSVMTYVLLAIILTGVMWVVWNKTTFGKNMFAVGSNEEAARVSGVNVLATIIGTFMIAGALYGYTGFVEAARLGSSTATLGLNYESDAIAAVVIGGVSFVGGTGKISGVVLGVFMMQLIMSGMTFLGISGNVTYIIKGAVILFACILDMRKYMTKK